MGSTGGPTRVYDTVSPSAEHLTLRSPCAHLLLLLRTTYTGRPLALSQPSVLRYDITGQTRDFDKGDQEGVWFIIDQGTGCMVWFIIDQGEVDESRQGQSVTTCIIDHTDHLAQLPCAHTTVNVAACRTRRSREPWCQVTDHNCHVSQSLTTGYISLQQFLGSI